LIVIVRSHSHRGTSCARMILSTIHLWHATKMAETGTYGLERPELRDHVRLTVNVKPRSREDKLILEPDGTITLRIVAPPVEGKANRMVVRFLAKRLGKSHSEVRIVAGLQSNVKVVEIANMSKAEISKQLAGNSH